MTEFEWLGQDNQLGLDIWNGKYRYENETFEEWLDRVSAGNENIKRLIREKKFLFGGRILASRGLEKKGKKVTFSNCYVITPPEDDIESIYEVASKLARTFSRGGGCGIDISKLSPRGAKVNNAAKETSGSVSFMDTYSQVTEQIGQNGRRGALMISLDCHHPDLEEFIDVKKDLNRVTKANISVRITDDFMQAVKENKEFELSFTRDETGEVIKKTVNAKDVFMKLAQNNWEMAEPGCLFWDRIENYNLMSESDEFHYAGVNPCVPGNTLILTDNGYKEIESLCDKEVNVWNGYEYSSVTPHITGRDQPMRKVTFSDGTILECTDYHKFILKNGDRVEAKNLNVGDKIIKCTYPVIEGDKDIDDIIAYTSGFFVGDGHYDKTRDRNLIRLYGEKRKLVDHLSYKNKWYCESFNGECLEIENNKFYDKDFVPDNTYDIKSRLTWLAGYLDSDGTIQSKEGSISISSIDRSRLMKVKMMLNTLGCNAWVSVMHEEEERYLPKNDGSGELQKYNCKESYRLLISSANAKKLIDLGLNTHRLSMSPSPNRDAGRFIIVKNVESIPNCDIVYCFNEPKNHSGIFNGIITAQCAEEPLPKGGSCLLGSINLSEFVTKYGIFDTLGFKGAVEHAVIALNDVLLEGLPLHPLSEQRDTVDAYRQIGLGIMGLADMLIKMKIPYGSKESIEVCDSIGKIMAQQALETSCMIAKEKGKFTECNMEDIVKSEFFSNHLPEEYEDYDEMMQYGLANSQLLTIAPTGSLSTMLGISGGIEPVFANYYNRKTQSLHGKDVYYKVYTPIVKEYMEANGISDDADLPEWFVTAGNLNWEQRIDMQSVWQKHIDASISSTVNVPNEFTVDDVFNLYINAWEKGLKGVTIYRDGCARSGVLVTDAPSDESNTKDEMGRGQIIPSSDNLIGLKRKLITGCGSLHCEAFFDPETKELREVYLSKGSTGGCNNFMIGLSRNISMAARAGVGIDDIVDQLMSTGSCPSYSARSATKHDTSKGSCCPMAVGYALRDMHDQFCDIKDVDSSNFNVCVSHLASDMVSNKCPVCGEELTFEGGCNICKACGWTKCD